MEEEQFVFFARQSGCTHRLGDNPQFTLCGKNWTKLGYATRTPHRGAMPECKRCFRDFGPRLQPLGTEAMIP